MEWIGYVHGPLYMGPLVTITVMYKSYIIVLYNNNPLQGLNVLTYILTY